MAFTHINIQEEIKNQKSSSPEFKQKWDESREEYRLIGEMISLRKKQSISQKELANLTGTKQQTISRIEKKENSPSLKFFCKLLNALGYELSIQKKTPR